MTDRTLYAEDGTTPLNEDPADTTPLMVDGSYGDVAFPAMAVAGDGFTLTDGTAAVAFTFAEAADGFLLTDGTSAVAFGWSTDGAGSISGGGVPEIPALPAGHAPIRLGPRPEPIPPPLAVSGSGGVAFGFSTSGHGWTNEDLFYLLAA